MLSLRTRCVDGCKTVSELMYDFQSERWNEFELPKLSLRELLALAKLLGCSSSGSKETKKRSSFAYLRSVSSASNWLALQTTVRSWQIPINVGRSATCAGKRVFGGPVANARSRRAS